MRIPGPYPMRSQAIYGSNVYAVQERLGFTDGSVLIDSDTCEVWSVGRPSGVVRHGVLEAGEQVVFDS